MDKRKVREDAEKSYNAMLADRRPYEAGWKEMRDTFAPSRGRFNTTEKPKKSVQRKNSRPFQIIDEFAAGIKSGLTSTSRTWFTLSVCDDAEVSTEWEKAYLVDVRTKMENQMLRTNLYDQLSEVYKEQGGFGTASIILEEDDERVFVAKAFTIGEYVIGVDPHGKVNRFGRSYTYTARQLAKEFGEEKLPEQIRATLREPENNTRYEVRNIIQPNREFKFDEPGPAGMPYQSLWWLVGHDTPEFLRESGYHEFPVMVVRWRTIGDDIYGREHPGQVALDDAQTLQLLETDAREALERQIKPAMIAPANLLNGHLRNEPNAINLYNSSANLTGPPVIRPLFDVRFDFQAAEMKIQMLAQSLEKTFYVDLFRMWSSDLRANRTATEIQAREAEKMYILAPLIERQMSELLDPLISRIYGIMDRRGMFAEPPQQLADRDLKIEYTSILANIQKQSAQAGIDTLLAVVERLAAMQGAAGERPSVFDKLDFDEVVDQVESMFAVPNIILGDDAVARIRAEKDQVAQEAQMQQAAMQAAQVAPGLAGAAKDMSETPVGEGSGLEAMLGVGGDVM